VTIFQHASGGYRRLAPAWIQPEAITKARIPADLEEALRLAAKLEPQLAKAIMDALAEQAAAVDLGALTQALETGDVSKVLGLLGLPSQPKVQDALQDAAWASGLATAAVINDRITGAAFAFNRLNPKLVGWLQGYSLDLIRQINETTREGVREVLIAGMRAGVNPRDQARAIKPVIGLTARQAKAVDNFRKELESFHLRGTAQSWNLGGKISRAPGGAQVYALDEDGNVKDGIIERRLRDFRFDRSLQRAMATGNPLTEAQIEKMVAAYGRKYLQFRAQTIARTEALRTTNFGIQDAWRQAIEEFKVPEEMVRRQWVVARDERLCEICGPIPGMNPKRGVKFGQPFNTPEGPMTLPPAHPNCRCTVWIRRFEAAQLEG
jgi:hypothetical protein